jgi:2'-5' RNA ligase
MLECCIGKPYNFFDSDLIMGKIAIDVVLLPPEEIMDKAIEVNRKLEDKKIVLDKNNCLPHISLCMGVVESENLAKVEKVIEDIASGHSKLELEIMGVSCDSAFEISKPNELQELHETITGAVSDYLTYDATVGAFFSPPAVEKKTLFWINGYRDNSSFEKFHPHITLGINESKPEKLNFRFIVSKLVICHLGNYCTCRKILFETRLGKN